MAEATVRYSFSDPRIFDLVAAYGEISVEGLGVVEDLVPPDMTFLSITLHGGWKHEKSDQPDQLLALATVIGPTSSATRVAGTAGSVFLAGLHPNCWPTWFGCKAAQFADRTVPLAQLLGPAADRLIEEMAASGSFEDRVAIMNRTFLELPRQKMADGLAARIMALRLALADPDCATVAELAKRVGLSPTQLSRLALTCFGFTPKLLLRIARFRRMLHFSDFHSYAQWRDFLEGQYVDQSHLIRDFQDFLGLSPSAYFSLERPFVAAAFKEARRLLGTPSLPSDIALAAE